MWLNDGSGSFALHDDFGGSFNDVALGDLDGDGVVFADGSRESFDAIVWATGFAQDFGWLQVGAFDDRGRPKHQRVSGYWTCRVHWSGVGVTAKGVGTAAVGVGLAMGIAVTMMRVGNGVGSADPRNV